MPTTNSITGKGTTIGYADDDEGVPTLLGEVKDSGFPEWSMGNVDATHYTSPDDMGEKIPTGWGDVADVPLQINYEKSQHASLVSLRGVKKYWTHTLPDGSTIGYYGWISKLGGGSVPNKDVITVAASMTVTGDVFFTPAGS